MPRTSSRQFIWLLIVLAVAAGLWYAHWPVTPVPNRTSVSGALLDEDHFSPEENLEQLDLAEIESARRSLDIAMYAFTDRHLAEAILRAAHRGVQIRIYRDRSEYDDEQRKSGWREGEPIMEMFRGEPNVQVRVKRSRELMHLKAYCVDGSRLRDGSANWSRSGLKWQDNNARFTTNPAQVQAFERGFEGMWSRDNEVVQ